MSKKIRLDVQYGVKDESYLQDEWKRSAHPYTVTLKYGTRQMTTPFFMGSAHTSEPDVDTVVSCLLADYQSVQYTETFEDFAREFGYDEDSREAEKTYKACIRNAKRLEKLLGSDLPKFQEQYQDY